MTPILPQRGAAKRNRHKAYGPSVGLLTRILDMMDKLFDGSDAHLLPGNAELIQRLRYERDDDERYEAADALEAADKRIAELEAAIIGWKADQKENMATAVEECKRANEAERKLAVALDSLKWAYATATDHDDRLPFDWAIYCESLYQTLAQIARR